MIRERIGGDRTLFKIASLSLALCSGFGCAQPRRGPLPPVVQADFHAASLKLLEEAAFGDDPAHRMQAIEAFKATAPQEGLGRLVIPLNIDNEYPGVAFAALMAAGEIRARTLLDRIRTRAESSNPHVKMAALFALHRLGSTGRTGELSGFLLKHPDARVRANAALVLGRMGENEHVKLLRMALRQERKSAPKLQILEALATYGDTYAAERLIFQGYSAIPQQSAIALMMLATAKCVQAEDLFWYRLQSSGHPEIQLQAARGLALLGHDDGFDVALRNLYFNAPIRGLADDPRDRQIARIRGLAALALEAIGDPAALAALKDAFDSKGQSDYVRIAVARAAIRIIGRRGTSNPPSRPEATAQGRGSG